MNLRRLAWAVGMSVAVMGASLAGGQSYAAEQVVVIDPGHGGRDSGTRSGRGRGSLLEKNVTLAIGRRIASDLRARGITVLLTRAADKFVPLAQRSAMANGVHAAMFVSVHADSNPDRSQRGFSVLMPERGGGAVREATNWISGSMSAAGMEEHTVRRDDRGLLVLHRTRGTALLVEVGFLSNRKEAAALGQAEEQERIADAIAEGIARSLGQ